MRPDRAALLATYRGQISRLRSLGVGVTEVGKDGTEKLARRFAQEFLDPDRARYFLFALRKEEPLDFDRWMRPDRLTRGRAGDCLGWLAAGLEEVQCVRLDRHGGMPALKIDLEAMDEAWVSSWPGVFVHFAAGRALAVTLHYEVFQCDLRGGAGSPYR